MIIAKKGFTIVELIIVITVIGILATITIFVYNGAQLKARNDQMALAVRAYKDAMSLYKYDNGAYPEPTTAGTKPCMGNEYPTSVCWFGSGTTDATLMGTLETTVGSKLPMPPLPNVALKGIMYMPPSAGYRVDGATYATATPVAMLVYAVENATTTCPVGPIASKPTNGNALWYSSTAPTTGQTVAASAYPVQCWLILPYK